VSTRIAIVYGCGTDVSAIIAALGACNSTAEFVTLDEHTALPLLRPAEATNTPTVPREAMMLTLTSEMFHAAEEYRPEPPPPRASHWQKHDRLPFYHGIRSRKQRRR
jgi:hypothetical protein